MLAKALTGALVGLDGVLVEVEADIGPGLPAFNVVGLPDTAIQEARERVRAAIRNAGCEFRLRRITVNLAPAVLRKESPGCDLPIAIGVLRASEQIPEEPLAEALFLGELSLAGAVRHIPGILPMVVSARERGLRRACVVTVDAAEAALVEGVEVVRSQASPGWSTPCAAMPCPSRCRADRTRRPIGATPSWSTSRTCAARRTSSARWRSRPPDSTNVLMASPPGSGKTLLARALPGILPPLSHGEALEVSKI